MINYRTVIDEFMGIGRLFKGGKFTETILGCEIFFYGLILTSMPTSLQNMTSIKLLDDVLDAWQIGTPMMVSGMVSLLGIFFTGKMLYTDDPSIWLQQLSRFTRFSGAVSALLIWSWIFIVGMLLQHILPTYAFYAFHIIACFRVMVVSWHNR